MEEEFILTAENWDSYVKEKDLFSFYVMRKPSFVRIFEAKKDIEVMIQEKDENGDNLVAYLKKGDVVACSQEGQVWTMSRYDLEKNYQALPIRENPDGTYTANWISQRE